MRLDIIDKGSLCGFAEITEEGLYYRIYAEVQRQEGLVRLWAHERGKGLLLGVMQPCGDILKLDKRISRSKLVFSEQSKITTCEHFYEAFDGEIVGIKASGLLDVCDDKRVLLLDFAQKPFSLMELVCFFRIEKRKDGIFWAVDLTDENVPVLMQISMDFD